MTVKSIPNITDAMIERLIQIADHAGKITLLTFQDKSLNVQHKCDRSVFTEADMKSHRFICQELKNYYPEIPIISEEANELDDYQVRKQWSRFFLVDPLDGSKEYIKGIPEFTINIALIEKNEPVMGVVHAPALALTYFAEKGEGAFKMVGAEGKPIRLASRVAREPTQKIDKTVRIAISRSHACSRTQVYIDKLKGVAEGNVTTIAAGSALKFGLIAEGSADIYPRFAPTMEWDTAAGQILVNEVGKKVFVVGEEGEAAATLELQSASATPATSRLQLQYNKEQLVNPGFVVE